MISPSCREVRDLFLSLSISVVKIIILLVISYQCHVISSVHIVKWTIVPMLNSVETKVLRKILVPIEKLETRSQDINGVRERTLPWPWDQVSIFKGIVMRFWIHSKTREYSQLLHIHHECNLSIFKSVRWVQILHKLD